MLLVHLIHARLTMRSSLRKWQRYAVAAEAGDWERDEARRRYQHPQGSRAALEALEAV